ncbi:hypothetical protein MMC14_001520 [Varicellaria rhodocarpa]|nr:hypothetical protein [Varicellaria rhodocarpa]
MPISKDPIAFTEAMADVLYLSDESLAMSYVYINRYHRFIRSSSATDLLDPYTLSLAAVSLSCKSTSSSRRLSLILAPAHALLHPPPAPPLKVPSTQYDCLRATLVRAELLLLRVLGFELRISTPLDFIERYTDRAMRDLREFAEDYDRWDLEERQEYGIANRMEIGLGRAVKVKALQAWVSKKRML